MTRRERLQALGRQGLIAALDVGSTKITCFIARPEPPREAGGPSLRIVGIGHQVSRGLKAGQVTDLGEAEEAIRRTVETAEHMAGALIHRVFLGVTCPTLASVHVGAGLVIGERDLTEADVTRVLAMARSRAPSGDGAILHAVPARYTVDGTTGIREPAGMFAGEISADVNVVTVAHAPARNLTHAVERCHLEIAGLIATPYASAISTLIEDECELGTLLLDMGGGTTSLAIMAEGRLQYVACLPVGGQHVTMDLARGLSTTLSHAERLKTLCGSALRSPTDDREPVSVPQAGEDERESAVQVPRSILTGIIRPRIEETLELVRDRLEASGFAHMVGRRMVMTGGASQLNGVKELAEHILGRQVRIGRPAGVAGLAEATGGPAFAAAAGLLAFPLCAPFEAPRGDGIQGRLSLLAPLDRMSRWLKASGW